MVKYSYELKQQVIQDYLDGLGGYKTLAKKYHLPTKSIILQLLTGFVITTRNVSKKIRLDLSN